MTLTQPSSDRTPSKEPIPAMRRFTLSVALLMLLAGCGGQQGAKNAEPAQALPAIAVQVAPARREAVQTSLSLSGDIRPALETPLAPKVGGRLEYLLADEGTRVKAGQVIGRIDPYDFQLQVLQAQATLAAAQANRASAAANHASASDNARRLASLHADGGVSDQQMIATRSQAQAAGNAVRAADAQIAQARATIALAQSQLANTDIKSPFAGVVTKKSAEVGTMLAPMTPVVTVAATQTLEIKVPLGQASLAAVRVGQPVSFTVPTYPGRVFAGKVSEVAPTVDPRTRTTQITIRIPNQDGTLAPGMFARVTVPTAVRPNALVVDADAIVSEGEQSFVYVVTGEVARRRPVTLGLRTNEKVEVVSGVQPGERVVTLGQGQLQDGDRVQIVTNTPAGADAPASGAGHEGKK